MSDLPNHDDLHGHCKELKEAGRRIRAWLPWEDYSLKPQDFPVMTPLHGGSEHYSVPHVKSLLEQAEAELPSLVGRAKMSVRSDIVRYQSWIRQLEGELLPEGTGAGYAAWVAYLQHDETPERKSA